MPKNKMLSPFVKSPVAAARKVPVVIGGQKNKASINRNEGCEWESWGCKNSISRGMNGGGEVCKEVERVI